MLAEFVTTQWSMIASATRDGPNSAAALSRLCGMYWPPLLTYALRRGLSWEDARDLTQDFFVKLLGKGLLDRADVERGKFRTFLLTSMQRHIDSWLRGNYALKRGGGQALFSFDEDRAALEKQSQAFMHSDLSPEAAYDLRWALIMLGQAVEKLKSQSDEAGRGEWFQQMRPFLSQDAQNGDYTDPAAVLGISPNNFAQAVKRLRERYREVLREVVAETLLDAETIDDEMESLMMALKATA